MHSYTARIDMTIKNDKSISLRLILFKNFVVIKREWRTGEPGVLQSTRLQSWTRLSN